jgi:hypothetical protein
MSNTSFRLALTHIGAMALLAGCTSTSGQPVEPLIFAFDYQLSTATQTAIDGREASINSGADVTDFMSGVPCKFLADFSDPLSDPNVTINGAAGAIGFNFSVASVTTPDLQPDDDPAACGNVEEFELLVGSRTEALVVGETTDDSSFSITVDGVAFSTGFGFFDAKLTAFNPATAYTVGTFRFIARGPLIDSNAGLYRIVTGEGSYWVK